MFKQVVLPGQAVMQLPDSGEVRLGAGLQLANDSIASTRSGVLNQTKQGKLWVEGRQRRCVPAAEELVIGTILERHSENFIVDIGGPFHALLPQLSFEGASRRNRPNLVVGDVVFARVITANRDMDPVLSCMDAAGKSAGFGQLKNGLLVTCNTAFARSLLGSPPHPVLPLLGGALQFEVAIGMNGRIWIHSASSATTIFIANALLQAEFETKEQTESRLERMLAQVR